MRSASHNWVQLNVIMCLPCAQRVVLALKAMLEACHMRIEELEQEMEFVEERIPEEGEASSCCRRLHHQRHRHYGLKASLRLGRRSSTASSETSAAPGGTPTAAASAEFGSNRRTAFIVVRRCHKAVARVLLNHSSASRRKVMDENARQKLLESLLRNESVQVMHRLVH